MEHSLGNILSDAFLSDDGDMQIAIALPDLSGPATLILDREHGLTDEAYFAFMKQIPDLNVERTRDGEIVIVPPAGGESDYRTLEAGGILRNWAVKDKRGRPFGATVQFMLPDGSGLSPDAAWVSNERLGVLSKREVRQFPRVVPEFVIEIMSPSDRLCDA